MVDMRYDGADLQAAGLSHSKLMESLEPLVVQLGRPDLPAGAPGTSTAGAIAGGMR